MNEALIKPFLPVEGGSGNVYITIPPPSPTLSIAITSPANNAAVVGDNPVSLTIVCTVNLSGLAPNEQWASSVFVSIQLDGKPHTAFLTSGDWTANGTTTWSWTGQTPTGGQLTIGASVNLIYGYGGGGGYMTKKADQITVEPSAVTLVVAAPSDGQVFIGTSTGYVISASGSASSSVAISSVGWQLFSGINTSGTAVSSGNMTPGPNGWSSWNGSISVSLGLYTLQITATDANNSTRIANVAVQVTLQADIFDTTARSYLRALVEFATKPFDNQGRSRVLTSGSASAGIADLDSTFYQSIALLLDDTYSTKANEAVSQTRICVEVLRKYIAVDSPTPAQAQALTKAELAYRQAAYLSLLQQVGTSYDEIRLARTYSSDDRQALAERLGIDLGSPGSDHLTALLFDPTILPSQPDPPPPAPLKLTEGGLEEIFGLVDTTRDPFSQGPAAATPQPNAQPQPIRWNLNGVQWSRNTDLDGFIYVSVTGAPLPALVVKLYADHARTREVGTGSAAGPTAVIVPSNNSGLSGKLTMTGTTTDQFVLSAMPRFLAWQRQHLRGVWQAQDFQFTQGAVAGDTQSQIASCNLSGVQPGQNTDANGLIYISLQQTAGPNYQVTLYSDAGRTKSVASGTSSTSTGQITLTEANNSGLSGSVTINYKADSTQISVPIVFTNPPLIDPDVLIPGDFAFPIAGDPAYSLFPARQTTVQGWISQLQAEAGGTLAGLNTIL